LIASANCPGVAERRGDRRDGIGGYPIGKRANDNFDPMALFGCAFETNQ
jgi:hypothetical protein